MATSDFHALNTGANANGAGTNFLKGMNDGIAGCDRLLAVYSYSFAASKECMEELWAMRRRDPDGASQRVILVKIDDTDVPALLGLETTGILMPVRARV